MICFHNKSVKHDSNPVAIGNDIENINSVPSKRKATISNIKVQNTPNYQKTINIKKPSPVQDVLGMLGHGCKKIISDGESDDDADSFIDKSSIAYVARVAENIDNLNIDQLYVSSYEDD